MYKCDKVTIQVHKTTCFFSFEVNFLFIIFMLSSKSVFSPKLSISSLVAKFTHFNLAAKFSAVNLLISLVEIYFVLWSWSVICFSVSPMFVSKLVYFDYIADVNGLNSIDF